MRGLVIIAGALVGCSSFGTTPTPDGGPPASGTDAAAAVDATADGPSAYAAVILSDQPLAYWRFGETTGPVARSEVGGPAMNAEIGGPPALGRPGAIVGDPNTAFEFTGQSSHFVTAKEKFDFVGTEPFSLETWLKLTKIDNTFRHVFVKDYMNNTPVREEYGIYVQQNVGVAFERHVTGDKIQLAEPISVNEWHHVVATYDGSRMRLYLDAKEVGVANDTRPQGTKTESFYMGRKGPNDGALHGLMDEVAVYGKALSFARIAAHYDAGAK